jgi:hypothetical protein
METFSRGTPKLDPWYVTGFAEGESCFTYSRSSGGVAQLYFAIKLTASDQPLLEAIRAFFGGIGAIYRVKPRTGPKSGLTKAAAYFRVSRIRELCRVINHFDRYPMKGNKALSYALWRQMVSMKLDRYHKTADPTFVLLAERLSLSSPRHRPWQAS